MEPEEQIELAIARLSRMGLPITWTAVFDIFAGDGRGVNGLFSI